MLKRLLKKKPTQKPTPTPGGQDHELTIICAFQKFIIKPDRCRQVCAAVELCEMIGILKQPVYFVCSVGASHGVDVTHQLSR